MVLPIWFLIVALLTEVMAAVVGFGSSTILTPLATFVFDIKTALAVVAIFHIIGALVRLYQFRPAIDRTFMIRFGLPAVVATLFGALLVRAIPSESLAVLLGIFLLLLVFFEWTHPRFHIARSDGNETIGGILTGFFGGLLGAGGAIRSASLQAFGMKKEEYIGTSALLAVLVDATRIPVYLASGYLSNVSMSTILLLVPLAVIGTLVGLRVVDHLSQRVFRLIVLAAIFLAALKLISNGI